MIVLRLVERVLNRLDEARKAVAEEIAYWFNENCDEPTVTDPTDDLAQDLWSIWIRFKE